MNGPLTNHQFSALHQAENEHPSKTKNNNLGGGKKKPKIHTFHMIKEPKTHTKKKSSSPKNQLRFS